MNVMRKPNFVYFVVVALIGAGCGASSPTYTEDEAAPPVDSHESYYGGTVSVDSVEAYEPVEVYDTYAYGGPATTESVDTYDPYGYTTPTTVEPVYGDVAVAEDSSGGMTEYGYEYEAPESDDDHRTASREYETSSREEVWDDDDWDTPSDYSYDDTDDWDTSYDSYEDSYEEDYTIEDVAMLDLTPSLDAPMEDKEVVAYDAWAEAEAEYQATRMLLTAECVGDHDNRADYIDFLRRHPGEYSSVGLDTTRRVRFQVLDEDGSPVNNAQITLVGSSNTVVGRTHADGVWDFFPSVSGSLLDGQVVAQIDTGQQGADVNVFIPSTGDAQDIILQLDDELYERPETLDLGFLIDVTGSMSDELSYVTTEVSDIVQRIESVTPGLQVRVGATFYRDRGDDFVVRQIPFTENVPGFVAAMRSVSAGGGGDYPEDMVAGLWASFNELEWSEGNVARVLVLIADAPPQLYYDTQYTYRDAMLSASERGIRILPVAASGADRSVEMLFRAMAAFTSTPYVYLTDDSGIGNSHLEADTEQVPTTEYFNDMLTRLVIADLRGEGMHELNSQHAIASSDSNQDQETDDVVRLVTLR